MCSDLLYDPYFSSKAPDYLAEIGGHDSGTAILYAWDSIRDYEWRYILALQKLKDPRAIPLIINSIGIQYHSLDNKLEVIEDISGESLQHLKDPARSFHGSTDNLKRDLWVWWIDYKKRKGIESI